MEACTYLNVVTASVLFGWLSFGACGGSQPPASAPAPASSESASSPSASAETTTVATPAAAAAPAASAPSAAASSGQPTDGPDRTLNDIRAVVAGNRDAFRACYERAAKSRPGIKGTFMLSFIVNPDGTVKSAQADQAKSEIHAPELETCAVAALKGLKFPPSRKGMETTVNYPFDFNPKGPSPKAGASSP